MVAVVQHYIDRVRKYNGVASVLVTKDGETVAEASGTQRGQAPLQFPTETVKATEILPDLDKHHGPPLEFGRMEATASDPKAQQQFGMIAGVKNGTQLNALATLNIRGERSVTCPGDLALVGLFRSRASLLAEILVLRHQLNIQRRRLPKRYAFGVKDRLIFAVLYWLAPTFINVCMPKTSSNGGFDLCGIKFVDLA